MNKVLMICIAVLTIALFCKPAEAKQEVLEGIEYWTTADSDVAPIQILSWMKSQKCTVVGIGKDEDTNREFGIFDLLAPEDNKQKVLLVRILLYMPLKEDGLVTLMGYTIAYENTNVISYKYNAAKDKYIVFSYADKEFKDNSKNKKATKPPNNETVPDNSTPFISNDIKYRSISY